MDGSIRGDDLFEDEVVETPILDITQAQRERAQKKVNDGDMLFPEEVEENKIREKRIKSSRSESKRIVPEVPQSILDEVGDALGDFDAEHANKKKIRALRKALQNLSLARYPKKIREKKKVIIKKKK